MATRTIESPGVEWNEYDLSQVISYANGTVVVVMGFAHQGPTNQVIEITSKEELMNVFFGAVGPQNAAERYFYHSGIEILNTPGKLLCIRLPYGSGKGSGFSTGYIATAFYGKNTKMTAADAIDKFCTNGTGLTPAYFNKVWENYAQTDDAEALSAARTAEQSVTLLNPEPQSFVISEELYQEIKDGVLEDWQSPVYDPIESGIEGYSYRVLNQDEVNPDEIEVADNTRDEFFAGREAVYLDASGNPDVSRTTMVTPEIVDQLVFKRGSNGVWFLCVDESLPDSGSDSEDTAEEAFSGRLYNAGNTEDVIGTYSINYTTGSGEAVVSDVTYNLVFNEGAWTAVADIDGDTTERAFVIGEPTENEGTVTVAAEEVGGEAVELSYVRDVQNVVSAGARFFRFLSFNDDVTVGKDKEGNYIVGVRTPDNPETIQYLRAVKTPYTGNWVNGTIIDNLRKSVFFTINKMESAVDKDYSGFYLTVCDQDAFVRRGHDAYSAIGTDIITDATALCLDGMDFSESATSAYSALNEYVAHYVYDTQSHRAYPNDEDVEIFSYENAKAKADELNHNSGDKRYTVYVSAEEDTGLKVTVHGDPTLSPGEQFRVKDSPIVPSRLRNFALNGLNSLSQSCVDSLPYVFSKTDFANALHIGVHRFFTNLENDKLSYATLETYTGSLDPESTLATKNGGKENYGLDRMTENHSSYIDVYMNPIFERTDEVPVLVRFGGRVKENVVDDQYVEREVSDDVSCEGVCVSLGGFRSCDEENQNEFIGNLPAKIDNALLLIDSVLERDIDIVIDGGLSTIWGYTYGISEAIEKTSEDATGLNYSNTGYDAKEYDENKYISKALKKVLRQLGTDAFYDIREACAIRDAVYSIFTQFNVFCSKTRKDCIFISDPPRFFFVHGEDTKASSKKDWVFSLDMYHPLKNLYEAANTSYSCTYMNWVKKYDNTLADFVWLPMSPFAAAIMCEVDAKYFMWWAPFGLNNGVLQTITDLAFRPNQGQCDYFYKTGFNPVCYFNDGGYVIWGQKTMLDKHSAFDRLNVRRLFLYLERRSMKAMRWFIAEPNTHFTRTQVIETLRPMYDYCVNNSGLYDYLLKCDEENNPPEIIDDNTLVVDIYLKPVRTIEFILLNFYATRTGADFSEIIG